MGTISTSDSDLTSIRLLGVAGAVTITGYYCNAYGQRVGESFTDTIGAASGGVAWAFPSVPDTAEFTRVMLSGDVYFDSLASNIGGATTADFTTNYTRYPTVLALAGDGLYNTFGRGAN